MNRRIGWREALLVTTGIVGGAALMACWDNLSFRLFTGASLTYPMILMVALHKGAILGGVTGSLMEKLLSKRLHEATPSCLMTGCIAVLLFFSARTPEGAFTWRLGLAHWLPTLIWGSFLVVFGLLGLRQKRNFNRGKSNSL